MDDDGCDDEAGEVRWSYIEEWRIGKRQNLMD